MTDRKGTTQAQLVFRDQFLGALRESAELNWRELRRGIDDLDAMTRPVPDTSAVPTRPYRVKP